MNVLFSMLNLGYLRPFESVLRLLVERGHAVRLLIHEESAMPGAAALAQRLLAEYPSISMARAYNPAREPEGATALDVRACLDYLHFSDRRYPAEYRRRAEKRAPPAFVRRCQRPLLTRSPIRRSLRVLLRVVERSIPSSQEVERCISDARPDVVLLTPLLGLRTTQPDYLKGARALGLPTMLCVASWDNLTSKSVVRPLPDVVTVWNEIQKREAVTLHGIPAEHVVVTGAQAFDEWFDWRPRRRLDFCRKVGLSPERPYLLYVCSTPFKGSPPEPVFVRRWIEEVRTAGDPALREAGILVRPHPKRTRDWETIDLSGFDNVSVWPRDGMSPTDVESKADYFDSMYHSAAVIGLNTSALIEAGIVGRPVHSLLVPEFRGSQDETLHFRYLVEVEGGLLHLAADLPSHLAQLSESLRSSSSDERARRFTRAFVRPYGIDVPAAPLFVEAVEALARRGRQPPAWQVPAFLRPLVLRFVAPALMREAEPARTTSSRRSTAGRKPRHRSRSGRESSS